ncbi:MAG TPA: DUF1501 domain-containing protein [Vicinamibacterales bacterium]|jgi:uncharacterized protein (DUF1501 family)|nr:DUF1501 domain-containing protein [Vicinamibacterales bacterium]
MKLSRRDLLKLALAGAAHPILPVKGIVSQVFAAPGAGDAKFLLVFLRGGYDAANVVIPIGSDFYYESRPTIAIPKPDAANPLSAVPLASADRASTWGLHPALKDTMLPLWRNGQLAFVPFAGTEDLTRSHFETQDSVETGMPVAAAGAPPRSYGSGFLNRLAAALDGAAAPVAFTDGLPTVMTGDIVVPNVSLKGTGRPAFDDRQMALLAEMYKGTRFEPLIAEGFDLRKTVAQQAEMMASGGMSGEMQAANRNAITARGFELEARRMAGLMRDKFNVAFIDVGGWDTHVNQGNAQGQLATLLSSLGQGLAAFAEQMGPAWSRTVVVVLSEFGRTFRENGTRGTDHGHGSAYWVLGGALQGGRFAGEEVEVAPRTLNQNRDWPVMNEYRAMLGGVFKRMYSLDNARLERVFPDTVPRDLGLV